MLYGHSYPKSLILQTIWLAVILVTAIIYDYLLTFSREIDYVWLRSWTWISTMFLLVRYLGVSLAILGGLYTTTFIPVTVSTAVTVVVFWQYVIFLAATDMVMVVRVYAMWNQSKWILGVLLFIYVSQVVSSLVMTGIISNPSAFHSVAGNQILGFSFCIGSWPNHMLIIYAVSLRLVLGIMLLVLAATQTLKQSVEMYKATGQWQPNQYFQQFTKDGIVYFVVDNNYKHHSAPGHQHNLFCNPDPAFASVHHWCTGVI
ncbi:hypothetical protein EV363DRAFT_1174062 [Boletus edulis]|nr:hypothetical protein EV363DRAFT_1174062 [Boletus edulis]